MLFFNLYNLRARIQPFLLAWLPILIMPLVMVPDVNWTVVLWIVLYFALTTLLVQLGRSSGKRLEKKIYRGMGGKPFATMLRHRDSRLDQHTKKRYLDFLSKNIRGLQLPSFDEERNSPDESDEKYRSATFWLLAQTTDREQFPLVFEENVNYGFRRNTWALKRPALCFNAIAVTLVGVSCCGQIEFLRVWLQALFPSLLPLFLWAAVALTHSFLFFSCS